MKLEVGVGPDGAPNSLAGRIASMRERIAAAALRAGREPDEIALVGVTKKQPRETIVAALEAGLTEIGENYVQEARPKYAGLPTRANTSSGTCRRTKRKRSSRPSTSFRRSTGSMRGARSRKPRARSANRCARWCRSTSRRPSGSASARATRRPRGEPRRLLLDAARDLFARQDYRSTTTREIAEAAGVIEPLLFRHFGSKAALFRETMVVPFTSFVDDFGRTWQFVEHQGLVLTLLASEALSEEEIADAGIADIRRALAVLGRISSEGMAIRGMQSSHPDLAAYSTVAMIAGMTALRSTYFGTRPPSREAIVEELTQAILHGFLHRDG